MTIMRLCVFLALCCAACGDSGPPRTYDCSEPSHIVILKRDEIRSSCFDKDGNPCSLVGIALAKGVSTRLLLGVYDDDKRECDPSQTVATTDGKDFDLVNDGTDVYVTPLADVFDTENGVEPTATLTVTYGALKAQWQMMAMVDLEGDWRITVDDLEVGDFAAAQSGRFIRWADCAPSDTSDECSSGLLFRNEAKLFSPIGALQLDGTIAPTRDRIDGTWKNGDQSGAWYAVKLPP